ncbi:hypothetical protein FNV43_RR23850 [Rhamnella rubrinervis]|uniref:Uncharacterized protein n=1 Tax=Rhamnella rubrinervis TaxID=2594499 RepID=A0A8K0GQ72_9ROSA|nr:hypothetical protein FNV43_RR23850 [Rhamnella rubrinervis]
MGNCLALSKPSIRSCIADVAAEEREVVRVVKTDGRVLTFRAPALVKDVLVNFANSGIGVSKEASEHLPLNYELNTGKVYYLLPSLGCSGCNTSVTSTTPDISSKENKEGSGIRRIKIVIPKQQLQELLARQITMEEILKGLDKKTRTSPVDASPNWKPKLESIPEGSEFINVNVMHSG